MLTEAQKQFLDDIAETFPEGFSIRALAYELEKSDEAVRGMMQRIQLKYPKAFQQIPGGWKLKNSLK